MKRGSTSAEIILQYRAWLLVAHTDKGGDATQKSANVGLAPAIPVEYCYCGNHSVFH